MKMERDDPTYPNHVPDYNFSRGERGKYVAAVPALAPGANIDVWAPLTGFRWSGLDRRVTDDTWICDGSSYKGYERDVCVDYLSKEETDTCRETRHWLHFVRRAQGELSASAGTNTFLLALWIVRPTATQVRWRFEEGGSERSVRRLLDRFQWIEGQAREEFDDHDLDAVSLVLPPLRSSYLAGRRLRNALALTFRGCVASEWQSAFICHAAAAEALLTCDRGSGLTGRLAEAYANLVARGSVDNGPAREEFKRLYSVRSDIVHGRAFDRGSAAGNVSDLAAFSDILRRLWRAILSSEAYRAALERPDAERKILLLG